MPKINIAGDIPNFGEALCGCRFYPRCEYGTYLCQSEEPNLLDVGNGHFIACHMEKEVYYSKYPFTFEI
jgi:oligopeptide/dipeptide ABC transporter ATP-binding protein